MKKLSIILAAIMLTATTAGANYIEGAPDQVQGDIMLINELDETMPIAEEAEAEVPAMDAEKTVAQGVVKAVTDTQIELDTMTLNVSDYTFYGDYNFNPVEAVKEGDEVYAIVSTAQTRSLPPQAYAYYVLIKTEDAQNVPFYAVVDSVDDEYIYTADDRYQLSYKDVPTEMFKTKNIVTAPELTIGSEIVFYADMMTMSIPALANPSQIKVLRVAEEAQEEVIMVTPAEFLQQAGILKGTDKGLELERFVTRAEAVTFISRISDAEVLGTATDAFNDVDESHWAYETVSWAKLAGIVEGTGDGNFEPDRNVSGKEFVKMVLSMAGVKDVTIETALELGKAAGIVTDDIAEKISNDVDLTREDVTVLIYNAMQK